MIFFQVMKMKFKEIAVGEIFKPVRGVSKYTRGYGFRHKGEFPVYSASTDTPLTYINSHDYEGDFLSWTTNGYAGSMKVLSGKFSINGDRALLIPKITGMKLNLDYYRLILEPIFRLNAVGRKVDGKRNEYTKLSPSKIIDISFLVPINGKGQIDLKTQSLMVRRANKLDDLKNKSKEICHIIANCIPVPSTNQNSLTILQLNGEWIEYVSTKTGWTKTIYNHLDSGDETHFPLYSAAKLPVAYIKEEINGLILANSKEPIISFASNGEGSAGTNFVFHTSPFYVSNDRICLKIIAKKILPEYVYFSLHGIKQAYGFGHTFKASKKNLEYVTINVPVKSNGDYDVKNQKQLVARYKKLYAIKNALESRLTDINNTTIAFLT